LVRALWTGLLWMLRGLWAAPARIGRSVRARMAPVGRGLRAVSGGLRSGARGLRRGVVLLTPWVVTAIGFAAGAVYLRENHDVGDWAMLYAAVQALPVAMAAYRPMAGWALSFLGAVTIPLVALPLD